MNKIFATCLLLTAAALAGNIGVPTGFDSAQVLPAGVRNLRYNYLMGEANNKFNAAGTVTGMGDPMHVDVSYQTLVDGQPTAVERGNLRGYVVKDGVRQMSDLAGRATGEVNVEVDAQVPVLAWGVTPRWTAALALPFLTVRTHVDTGFVASEDLQRVADQLVAEGRAYKARFVRDKTDSAVSDKNDNYGYEPLPDASSYREERALGDIRLVNKVLLTSQSNYRLALINDLALPTGRRANINRSVDVPTGDGQFDVGLGVVGEYYWGTRTTFWSRFGYTWQAPDEVARRVPEGAESSLSRDLDGQISRDLGDSFYASAGSSVEVYQGLKLKAQYSFQIKGRDQYQGNKYESYRYSYLGSDTDQSLHAMQLGASYSTIPLFQSKKFPMPLEFNVMAGIPLAGRNVVQDTSLLAEAAVYF